VQMDSFGSVLYFAFDAAAALLLAATWQQTRIPGFMVLAASYVLGIVARWMVPLLYHWSSGDDLRGAIFMFLVKPIWFVTAAIALYGIWDIYRQLKRRVPAAPPAA
jgi:hypothetical protein